MRRKTEKELNLQGRRVGIDVGPQPNCSLWFSTPKCSLLFFM